MESYSPLIIGGSPGSGTRMFCQIAIDAGIYMGTNTNTTYANDAMEFFKFYAKWVNFWLLRKKRPLSINQKKKMLEEFKACEKLHLESKPANKLLWGFKNPRSIHLLSFLHEVYPKMKFLHVVRDGRDVAYTKWGAWVVKKHGKVLLGKEIQNARDRLQVWSHTHIEASSYGESKMNEHNYFRVRFEDLCFDTKNTIESIQRFWNISNIDLTSTINKVKMVPSIGRWKKHESEMSNLSKLDLMALEHFGYLN